MDENIYDEWLSWMQSVQIPAVMATGYFDAYRLLNVLDSPNEGITCCIQYQVNDLESYRQYNSGHQQQLQAAHQRQFENKLVLFNTLMKTID